MADRDLRSALRAATEDDVESAMDASGMDDQLHGVAPVLLLEFFNRMLDELLGEDTD